MRKSLKATVLSLTLVVLLGTGLFFGLDSYITGHSLLGHSVCADSIQCPEASDGKACTSCWCEGDYNKGLPPEAPDNPQNKKYPRRACKNWCTKACCGCIKRK